MRGNATTPDDWRAWLAATFPGYVAHPFGARHVALWEWVWSIRRGVRPPPFIEIVPRGGGKSTSAELACVAVATPRGDDPRPPRAYGWYLCETQDQADDHVQNVAGLLETAGFERDVNKYGTSKGWRRNRVRTAQGFTLDALGLDVARRGAKLDEQRPDWLVFDDIDGELDTEETTEKKIIVLTRKLLPAGSPDLAVLGIQNLVQPHGVFARIADGRADFLRDRILYGPEPALRDFSYDERTGLVSGVPTWAGQDLAACQQYVETWGIDAFRAECQHETVGGVGRFLPSMALWDACRDDDLPQLSPHEPCVLAIDAGEANDTFACGLISAHPRDRERIAVRQSRAYVPDGAVLDFDAIEADLRAWIARYAVQELVYDPMLMGQIVRRLAGIVRCEPFGQGQARLEADKGLFDLITTRRFAHDGDAQLRQHVDNANRKMDADGRRMRIVKRQKALKIDLCVMLSMGCARWQAEYRGPITVHAPAPVANRWRI